MDRKIFTASVLAAALGFAGSAGASAAYAQSMSQSQMMQVRQANMQRMAAEHLQKCYGINAIGRNDCAAGAHSCAGQATRADDPNSFVLLPQGDCSKIAGGALKPA
ncbi:BufA1 family periplasmic bufferin-type metallophore [Acidisoma sp. C75]